MSARKAIRKVGPLALAVLALFAITASSAVAFVGYGAPTFFGASGSGEGQFKEPAGVAINDSSGDVYIYDAGNLRVERFDSTGSKFEGQFDGSTSPTGQFAPPASVSEYATHGTLFNLAVDNDISSPSAGDVYVVDPGHKLIDKFTATGVYLSQLAGFAAPIFGVAVDTSGNVWVAEEGSEVGVFHGPVQEFDNSIVNKHIAELNPEGLRSPGISVDPEQNLYLLRGTPNIVKVNKEGTTLVPELTSCGCGKALAFDSSDSNLFFDEGGSIAVYPGSAEPFSAPTETLAGVSSSYGVGVDAITHSLYASQREADTVALFKFGTLPDVTTNLATELHRTSAKLEGEVNPDGQEVTSCEFEYGTNTAYGQTVPCATAPGSGSSPVPVSAEATGLTAETTYHYRLVAANTTGPHVGGDQEFTTLPAVESLLTEGALAVTGTTATLQGSFEPNGFDTHYRFEYHLIGAPASFTPLEDGGSAGEDKHVSAELSGLTPNAIYLFRLLAENQFGQSTGGFRILKTQVLAPVILGSPSVSFVKAQSAVLSATLNPEHTITHYHFEYGPCPTLAGCMGIQSTPEESSTAYGQIGTSAEVVGLASGTTYAYRLVAVNEFEEAGEPRHDSATGAEGTFTTAPAPVPSAETGASSAVTPTSAIVTGTADPDGLPASYAFELGVYSGAGTQYGVVFSGSAGSGASPLEETLQLVGLQPGTTYAYRITVSSGYIFNKTHTVQGGTVTFTTGGVPSVLALPPVLAQLPIPLVTFPKAATAPKRKPKVTSKKKSKAHSKKHKKAKAVKGKKARRV